MAQPTAGHTRPQLFSGARGQMKVNGKVIAFVTDVTVNVTANVRPVHTFGAPNARSVEPLSTGANVTIGRVIPVNKPDGAAVNTSAISGQFAGIEPVIAQMLQAEDITITIEDKYTQATVAEVRHCRFAGRTLSLSAQQIASERINLVGIFDAKDNTSDDVGL
jgi:hypothetical protein